MSYHGIRAYCECGAPGVWEYGLFWCGDEHQHAIWLREQQEYDKEEDET